MLTSSHVPATDRQVEVDGQRLHIRDTGDPGSPPVVMLHGIMGHAREWDTLVAAMVPPYRMIVVDQRGHGESDWASSYTASGMAGDLIGLVEHLEVAPVSVVGHSMGGMAALLAAARRPDLFERLVVVDIGPDALTTEFALAAPGWMPEMATAVYPSVDAAVAEWAAGNPLVREDLLRHYVAHCLVPADGGGLRWRFDAAGLTAFFTEGTSEDELWEAIDRLACPVLIVRGEHSEILSPSSAERMRERLPAGSAVAEIPGGGHDLGVEQPDAVARAAAEFLAGLAA